MLKEDIKNKKVLIISHTDLDGCGGVILSKRYSELLNYPDIIMANYNEPDYDYNKLKDYNYIIYSDFSPDEKSRNIIQENNIECICHDHHTAVENELKQYTYDKFTFNFDNTICGTKIYYNWLVDNFNIPTNTCMEEFIELVNTYDMWDKTSDLWPKAQDLNRLLYKVIDYKIQSIKKYDLFVKMMNMKFDNETDHFVYNRMELDKIQQDKNRELELFNEIISKPGKTIKTRKDEKGRYFAVIRCNSKVSAICNRLLEKYKKLDYVIALNSYSRENPSVSLRSKDHVNVLEMERVRGHECAAGMEDASLEDHENIWSGKVFSIPYKKE